MESDGLLYSLTLFRPIGAIHTQHITLERLIITIRYIEHCKQWLPHAT